jgi:hypothetical protein
MSEVCRYQPKATLCRTLALLWIFPSLGAVVILLLGFRKWQRVDGPLGAVQAMTLEQWIALAVLLAHPAFIFLARRLAKIEPFRELPPEDAQDSKL